MCLRLYIWWIKTCRSLYISQWLCLRFRVLWYMFSIVEETPPNNTKMHAGLLLTTKTKSVCKSFVCRMQRKNHNSLCDGLEKAILAWLLFISFFLCELLGWKIFGVWNIPGWDARPSKWGGNSIYQKDSCWRQSRSRITFQFSGRFCAPSPVYCIFAWLDLLPLLQMGDTRVPIPVNRPAGNSTSAPTQSATSTVSLLSSIFPQAWKFLLHQLLETYG